MKDAPESYALGPLDYGPVRLWTGLVVESPDGARLRDIWEWGGAVRAKDKLIGELERRLGERREIGLGLGPPANGSRRAKTKRALVIAHRLVDCLGARDPPRRPRPRGRTPGPRSRPLAAAEESQTVGSDFVSHRDFPASAGSAVSSQAARPPGRSPAKPRVLMHDLPRDAR